MRRLILVVVLSLAVVFPGAPAMGKNDPLVYASSHTKHEGMNHGNDKGGRHSGGQHHGNKGGQGDDDAKPASKSKPNDVVNLLLVLLIPAGMGAIGGRMLRRTRVTPAG